MKDENIWLSLKGREEVTDAELLIFFCHCFINSLMVQRKLLMHASKTEMWRFLDLFLCYSSVLKYEDLVLGLNVLLEAPLTWMWSDIWRCHSWTCYRRSSGSFCWTDWQYCAFKGCKGILIQIRMFASADLLVYTPVNQTDNHTMRSHQRSWASMVWSL